MSRRLTVLLTNNSLAERRGSELYLRDVAVGLLERGHTPIAYSSNLGEVADELRAATVPVVEDLDCLGKPPDIIHGQHHIETMTALLHFPEVPAVYFCHGWLPWEEMPPHFPRILRYVAVDDTCRDRLVCEHGIAENQVRVLLNFVNLQRFRPRPQLPIRPQRALVFSNYATPDNYLPTVRLACDRLGLHLDVVGLGVCASCAHPEELLGNYDLVFAKARAALEALAVGTAVVLCDRWGLGPLVTSGEVERLRRLNFGIRCLRDPVTVDSLLREIARYDPIDAGVVAQQVRASASLNATLDELVALYQDVVGAAELAGRADHNAEARSVAAYLRSVSPGFQQRSLTSLHQQCHLLRMEVVRLRQEQATTGTARQFLTHLRALLIRIPLLGGLARIGVRWVRECRHWYRANRLAPKQARQ